MGKRDKEPDRECTIKHISIVNTQDSILPGNSGRWCRRCLEIISEAQEPETVFLQLLSVIDGGVLSEPVICLALSAAQYAGQVYSIGLRNPSESCQCFLLEDIEQHALQWAVPKWQVNVSGVAVVYLVCQNSLEKQPISRGQGRRDLL